MSGPQSRRLALPTGIDAHFLQWGTPRPDALSVVLVHGFLDLSWGWEEMVDAGLGARFHVLAPDMRGHGDSGRVGPGGYYHFMDYVADLHGLIEKAAGPRLALVGHSMGGSIVSYYAGAFPERVERVVLMEGLGPPEDDGAAPSRVARWVKAWAKRSASVSRGYPSVSAAAERLRAGDALLTAERAERLAERGTTLGDDGLRRFKHDPLHLTRGPYAFRVDVAAQFWARIACPVLLVEGSESSFRAMGPEIERRAAHFPDARRVVLEGAGHMMQRHQPEKLAGLLLDFLG